jgi:succinate dehydrogenase / fumarate reductase cytochrome b subunit
MVSKDKRPVNLDIGSMQLPITAYVSITHRLSGVFLFLVSGLMVWALDTSLRSEEGFNSVSATLAMPVSKAILWLIASALSYHALSGVKHIIMDFGIGETMQGGVTGARIVIVLAIALAVFWGVVIW